MRLKMRPEDQLHCVSVTTPFRGAITVLEVVTPNPLVSKEKKESLFELLYRSGVLGSPRIFYKAQEIAGFHR